MSEDPQVPRMPEPAGKPPSGESPPERKETHAEPLIPPIAADEDSGKGGKTGTLPTGFTGALEQDKEVLPEPDLSQAGTVIKGGLEPVEGQPEPYEQVKRRGVTGQLGAFITGILRGSPAEGKPGGAGRKRPQTDLDQGVSELRQNLAQSEADQSRQPGETGELFHSFTGALKWVTNPRKLTGLLFRRGLTGELQQPVKGIPPLEHPKEESEEGGLADHLGAALPVEPPGISEPDDLALDLLQGKPPANILEEPAGQTGLEDFLIELRQSKPPAGEPAPQPPEPPAAVEETFQEDLDSRFERFGGGEAEAAEPLYVSFEEAREAPSAQEPPAGPVEPPGEEQGPAEIVPPEPLPGPLAGEEPARAKGSGSLLRRVTGSLRRVTGSLQGAEQPQAGAESEAGAAEPHPPEKRRGITGQLGQIITGILRGAPAEGGAARAERKPQSEIDEYVSELRQNLATEEASQPKPVGRTGRLIQTITGSLRRVTGPLGQTGRLFRRDKTSQPEQAEAAPPLAPLEAEIEQDILASRLSTTSVAEPAAWVEPEDFVIELGPEEPPVDLLGEPAALPEGGQGELPEPEGESLQQAGPQPAGVDSITLLESGAIAALDQAEEQARQAESSQDWMAELRSEAAEDQSARDSGAAGEKRPSATAQLRSFISGILRIPEEKEQAPAAPGGQSMGPEEGVSLESPGEVSDDLVSGRLDRSLGIAGEEAQPEELQFFQPEEFAEGPGQAPVVDEETLLAGLESRFDQVSGMETEEPGYTPFEEAAQPYTSFEDAGEPFSPFEETEQPYTSFRLDQTEGLDAAQPLEPPIPFAPAEPQGLDQPFGLTPEDERLIWGEQEPGPFEEGRTIRAEDFWDQIELSRGLAPEAENEAADDTYAAAFLAGGSTRFEEEPLDQEARPYQAPELPHARGPQEPFEDIRSIVLEDLPAEERPQPPAVQEAPGGQAVVEEAALQETADLLEPAPAAGWKARLAALPLMQKILIAEAIVVGLALVVAIPYFLALMLSGPGEITPTNFLAPRALPAGVPYPTGLTLPGGWYFKLNKSTFVDGQWKPSGAEWLEGTELRRVVALPWNPQTEAVVQTFQPGDVVELYLSNSTSIRFKVTQIERVPVDQVRVYTDLRPSLAIILYREKSDERWVVISHR